MNIYINFMSHDSAQRGFNILLDHAKKNNDFLSYKDYKLIVSDAVYNTEPTYGWTLEMLMKSKILPNYHMFVLELPYPEYVER